MASLVSRVADTVARKIGEGYDRPDGDSSLPLDVNYAKVSEWLVDRKLVPSDWNRKLLAIQAKAAAAAAALPPGFLAALPGERRAAAVRTHTLSRPAATPPEQHRAQQPQQHWVGCCALQVGPTRRWTTFAAGRCWRAWWRRARSAGCWGR